jgi:cytochrome c peroxidase
VVAALGVFVVACWGGRTDSPDLGPAPPKVGVVTTAAEPVNPRPLRRFQPLSPVDARAAAAPIVDLGKKLFFDPRLSIDGSKSCNSCHPLDRFGVDHERTSIGQSGRRGTRNAPTVYNAARHVAQFWDGRVATLEEQAAGPIFNIDEMGMLDATHVERTLRAVPGYVTDFAAVFPHDGGDIRFEHVTRAIAAFERTLITPGRWDRYLRGDARALSAAEIEGLRVFSDVGCVQCHTGELVGGSMFQRVGQAAPWPNQRDQGRYEVTGLDTDRMVFKVPSLRNVRQTAPYFHDGSVDSLEEAIRMMGEYQLGIELTEAEVGAIATWLGTLDGER